ncbi:DUF6089 family protein [Polaribacter sp. AHE13PA]|uniref:type IX secretion system protein PorG n=1 Tax=Polaribacter sp. AHE13PA TaxID=2745562 RepID=UPI001C4E9D13|nr:DUF6089 family protein [Polaribacter sp. AHE13PA]QXP65614.1 hypothetical protein H0I28_10330 [Polaribacter sp. AHE13PA]
MKKRILFFVFVSFTSIFMGQLHEVGLTIGGTNYVGDIGKNYYFYPNELAGGITYKYNWNPRIALRASYSLLPISGNDADADTGYRRDRLDASGKTYKFSNNINELAVGIEYNFYEYDLSSYDKTWTPYLILELAVFNHTNVSSYLPTGGIEKLGKKTSLAIPFGFGYKSKLYGTLAFAIEAKFRYTFEDDLDYLSNDTPNVNLDGTGNDWYMFTGVSLIYTFGRPACYTNGL